MEKVWIKIPAEEKFVQMIRLTTASLANGYGFDVEGIEDLKLSVSEALNYTFEKNDEIELVFELGDSFAIVIKAKEWPAEDHAGFKMGRLILDSLMDETDFRENELKIVKYL